MSILGNLAPNIVDFPLRGDTSFTLAVVNPDGTPFNLDPTNAYAFSVYKNADDAAPLVGPMAVGTGLTLLVPATAGKIKIAFSGPQALLMSAQQLYDFLLVVSNNLGAAVLLVTGKLIPNLDPASASYSTGGVTSTLLSTTTLNTLNLLGLVGGVGYLDGIATLNQDVNCTVQFLGDGTNPVQWILETSTAATVAGVTQRPLDYSVSNTKVWRRIM